MITTNATTHKIAEKLSQPKKAKAPARKALSLREQLAQMTETVADKVAPLIATGLDGDAGPEMEQVGEVVTPAKAKIDHSDTLLALLDRPERATPRAMMDATGLSRQGVNLAVGQLLKARGLKVTTQKNPTPDPADRKNTSFLYGVERA
jgi:hypothetical protein